MNVGTLKLENASGVYFLHSTKKVEDILSREEMERHFIGHPALAKHIQMSPVANEEEKTVA